MDQQRSFLDKLPLDTLSVGGWVVIIIAVLSSIGVALMPTTQTGGLVFWTFAQDHHRMYVPVVEQWNQERPDGKIDMKLLDSGALERRMMSGFFSGTPVADMVEVHAAIAGRSFMGPIEGVGFTDLTDHLHKPGPDGRTLYEQFNEPSFGTWTTRGRTFGLPHDVHPVVLVYRADIVEAAGIDVEQIKTWSDFERITKVLRVDRDGDGQIDQFPLGLASDTDQWKVEALMQQAGGTYFNNPGVAANRPGFELGEVDACVAKQLQGSDQ